jgi:hypothetical protein
VIAPTRDIDRIRWLSYRNDAGEEIPAFALVRPTGADTDGTLVVGKPNSDGQLVYVNGPVPCPDGGYGLCTVDDPVFVYYDSGGTPAFGETWGAANGSWKLTEGKQGWRILGANDTDRTLTLADRPAYSLSFRGFQAKANNLNTTVTSGSVPDAKVDWLNNGKIPTFDNIYFNTSADAELSGGTPDVVAINTEGLWYVSAQVLWESNTTGDRGLAIGQGDSGNYEFVWSVQRAASGANKMMQRVSGLMLGVASKEFWIALKQDSGSTLTVYSWILDGVYLGNYV